MKKLLLGVVTAGTLLTAAAAPALAQVGFYVGPGGFGVGVGAPYYEYGYPYGGYYDYYGSPGVVVSPGWRWHRHWRHYR